MKKAAIYMVLLILVCVLAGAAYNYLALRHYQALYPAPGNFYSVYGYRMHLYCTGAGSPTVVLESGLGSGWIRWQQVQPELAKITRVCSYDRVGLGSSDPRSGPSNAITIADQLHELLTQAGITGPLVLVGQSAGGLYVRRYAAKYFPDLVGLVLVDSTPPESFDLIPSNRETSLQRAQRHGTAVYWEFKDAIGLSRVLGECRATLPPGLQSYIGFAQSNQCRPEYEVSWLGETDNFESSASEVARTAFEDLPLVVISQDPDRPKPGWSNSDIAANPIWASMQENLKKLSMRSVRIIAKSSGHHVENDRPDVVTAAINELILDFRGASIDQPRYGMTVTR